MIQVITKTAKLLVNFCYKIELLVSTSNKIENLKHIHTVYLGTTRTYVLFVPRLTLIVRSYKNLGQLSFSIINFF